MARIFVVSEYVGANQNSTGYYWEKIIGKMQREFGGLTVIFPLTAGETPPVVSPSVEQECFKFPRSNKNRLLSVLSKIDFSCQTRRCGIEWNQPCSSTDDVSLAKVCPRFQVGAAGA